MLEPIYICDEELGISFPYWFPEDISPEHWEDDYFVQLSIAIAGFNDMKLRLEARKVHDSPEVLAVVCHATSDTFLVHDYYQGHKISRPISIEEVVDSLYSHPREMKTTRVILLLSCSAGVGEEESLAQQLADALEIPVHAALGDVFIGEAGEIFVYTGEPEDGDVMAELSPDRQWRKWDNFFPASWDKEFEEGIWPN